MSTIKIIQTRKIPNSATAEFQVQFLRGTLNPGDLFITYDTHHPVKWTVIKVTPEDQHCMVLYRTPLGLAWDDQFAGGIVDTEAMKKPEAYSYPPSSLLARQGRRN